MKRIFILSIVLCTVLTGFAQVDTTAKRPTDSTKSTPDTLKIGGMVIIREPGSSDDGGEGTKRRGLRISTRNKKDDTDAILSTNWWIFDIGFSNYNDQTIYGSPATEAIAPGSTEDWFKLRPGKSRSVNIWIVMQRLNLVKQVVNLKYGLGLELNNYFFEDE